MLRTLLLVLFVSLSCSTPSGRNSLTLEIAKNSYRAGYIRAGLDFDVCSDSSVSWKYLRDSADLKSNEWRNRLMGE